MASLIQIGVAGLQAQQGALSVVGQNITNASTEGYTRQRAEIVAQAAGAGNGPLQASGARFDKMVRVADAFIDEQVRIDTSYSGEMDAFTQRINRFEGTLFNSDFGLDVALSEFFSAVNEASNEPSDTAMRQFVLSSAEGLAGRFRNLADRTFLQDQELVASMTATVAQANEAASVIGSLNTKIGLLQHNRDSGARNLLLDEREKALKDLSALMSISVSEQSDGQVNVFVGKGQPMILGPSAAALEVSHSGDLLLQPVGNGPPEIVTSTIRGGEIGGMLSYRDKVLWPAQNELGRLAASISVALNQQHALGTDLEGRFGENLFRELNDPDLVGKRIDYLPVQVQGAGPDSGTVRVYVDDPFQGSASDYEIRFREDGGYTVYRRSDGEEVESGSRFVPPEEIAFDGVRVEFVAGDFPPGSSILVRPYADYARDISVVLKDPGALALASPIVIEAAPANAGDAQVVVNAISDSNHPFFASALEVVPPLMIEFFSDTEYRVLDASDPVNPVPLQPDVGSRSLVPGAENHLVPYIPGTTVVNSAGPVLGRMSAPATVPSTNPVGNGYPPGAMIFEYDDSGFDLQPRIAPLAGDASAREIALRAAALPGVDASARTEVTLQDLSVNGGGTPATLAINGHTLSGFGSLAELADMIAQNDELAKAGIVARSDGQTLVLAAQYGDDLSLHFLGDASEAVSVVNQQGQQEVLRGLGAADYSTVTVGGRISVVLDPGVRMRTEYDGVFAVNPEHERADFGFDLGLVGGVKQGDRFLIDFNEGGIADNRNGLALSTMASKALIGDPERSFANAYGDLVQRVGTSASQAVINQEAAHSLLAQSEAFRESVSGVNLDEEAGNLIRYEQAYNASAQVVSVARDIFNILLDAVR